MAARAGASCQSGRERLVVRVASDRKVAHANRLRPAGAGGLEAGPEVGRPACLTGRRGVSGISNSQSVGNKKMIGAIKECQA